MTARQMRIALWASVICLALAASISGITNGFAMDDVHVIVNDTRGHSLAHWWTAFSQSYWSASFGGDLYRPLTRLGFAFQWTVGGGSPLVFHSVSIGLYALVCAAFLGVLLELLPALAAWLGAALFAVHPLHVEAVGNVVGQAELWAALFMFLALLVFLRSRRRGNVTVRDTCIIVALYALGCLSKEHAIVLPLLLLAAEVTVLVGDSSPRARILEIRRLILLLAVTGVAFVWLRIEVLGVQAAAPDESNMLFYGQPFHFRAMTMLVVVLDWLRLFFWPAHLSADYSPRVIELVTRPTTEMVASAAIVVGLSGLAWVARRTAPVATFAFLWTAIALIIPSNLIIPTGFVLAERTLFVASGGVMLAVAALAAHFSGSWATLPRQSRTFVSVGIGTILLLGVIASALRQRVWHDDYTLFAQTVADAPASYKAHMAYAGLLFEKQQRKEAFEHIAIAHALVPANLDALQYAAANYSGVEGCQHAVGLYAHVLDEEPRRAEARVGFVQCLTAMGRYSEARKAIRAGLATGESMGAFQRLLFVNDSVEASARHTRASSPGR
ncbi:MAG: tetratricopeptide repeat protein [Gemmatimonadaceae bacterium]